LLSSPKERRENCRPTGKAFFYFRTFVDDKQLSRFKKSPSLKTSKLHRPTFQKTAQNGQKQPVFDRNRPLFTAKSAPIAAKLALRYTV
jgi:hypothetical protein